MLECREASLLPRSRGVAADIGAILELDALTFDEFFVELFKLSCQRLQAVAQKVVNQVLLGRASNTSSTHNTSWGLPTQVRINARNHGAHFSGTCTIADSIWGQC